MECDFCGLKCNRLYKICCPTSEQTCLDCVNNLHVGTHTVCSQCNRPIGKKIRPIIQALKQRESVNNQCPPQLFPQQQQIYQPHVLQHMPRPASQYLGPAQMYGPNDFKGYSPEQYQPYLYCYSNPYMQSSQGQWTERECYPQMSQSRVSRQGQIPQMNMNRFGCLNRDLSEYNGINPRHPLWQEACEQVSFFMRNGSFGQSKMHNSFESEPEEPVYSNGRMMRAPRFGNFTTDNIEESKQSCHQQKLNRSSSSINIRQKSNQNESL